MGDGERPGEEMARVGELQKGLININKYLSMWRIPWKALFGLLIVTIPVLQAAHECPAGFECSHSGNRQCRDGEFSLLGDLKCHPCPAGHRCPSKAKQPELCEGGFFSAEGNSGCSLCPKGFECSQGSSEPVPCIQYKTFSPKQGASACQNCPAGHQCHHRDQYPELCEIGSYALQGDGICNPCPAGEECLSVSQAPSKKCPLGHYSLQGEPACKPCPKGYRCPHAGEKPTKCEQGTYALGESRECEKCPAGFKCQSPALIPTPCIYRQEYSLEGSAECAGCPENHECSVPNQPPKKCGSGFKATYGSGYCIPEAENETEELKEEFQWSERLLVGSCPNGQYPDPTNSNTCVDCPAGKDCTDGYYFLRDCPQGTYSKLSEQTCTVCPAGSSCASNTVDPVLCSNGEFSLAGAVSCTPCPSGYACPNKDATGITYCQNGSYSTGSQTVCSQCPADSFCNAFAATPCHAQMWSPLGDYQCYWCPAGFSCNKVAGTSSACASGQYSLEKHLTCTSCPSGFYCPNAGEAPVPCPPNQFSSAGATACTDCGSGQYSFIGWSSCSALPTGFYTPSGAGKIPQLAKFGTYANSQTAMTVCSAGKLCGQGSTSATGTIDCPGGFYCEQRDSASYVGTVVCPAGTYRAAAGTASSASDCIACSAGSYCPPGTSAPIPCPMGYYCPAGAKFATENPCPDGSWSTAEGASSTGDCAPCPNGFACIGGIKNYCEPGYYCTLGNPTSSVTACPVGKYQPYNRQSLASECLDCPAGHYCQSTAMHTPTPCGAGFYNSNTGSSAPTDCVECDAGSVCQKPAMRYNDNRFFCEPGYFCPAGSQHPRPQPCPAHYYSDRTDLTQASDCTRCPEGYWCPEAATFMGQGSKNVLDVDANPGNKPILCPEGWYCPLNGDAVKCPAGSWNPTRGAFLLDHCKPCPAGFYCNQGSGSNPAPILCTSHHYCPPGSAAPVACPDGTYSPHDGTLWPSYMAATHVSDCFANHPGYYGRLVACPVNTYNPFYWGASSSATTDQRGCWPTPEGYSTNGLTAQITPTPCPIGQYSAVGSSCQNCPAQYYCDEFALGDSVRQAEKLCPAGYYCPGGAEGLKIECRVGYYCLAGSSAETPCSAGTWSFHTRQGTACPSMISGYYHDTSAHAAVLCPKGKYCTGGTTQSTIQSCPVTTFNPYLGAKTSDYCTPCPIGFICNDAAGTVDPTVCPVGKYCPRGSSSGTNCPAGTFSNSEGLKQESDCSPCWAGSYCATAGLSAVTGACDAGYYCPASSTSNQQSVCQKHAYCETGTPYPTNCAPGQYSSATGQQTSAGCQACPAGQFCTGLVDPQDCAAGYYCTGGSSTAFQNVAEVGYKATAGSSTQTICPGRRYNFDIAQESCRKCPPGYYCTSGLLHDCYSKGTTSTADDDYNQYCAELETVSACSTGKYSINPNSMSVSDCLDCLPGYKCTSPMTLATPEVILSLASDDFEAGLYGWAGTGYTTPAGYASEASEASYAFPCPAGTSNSATGSTTLACTALASNYASLGGYAYGVSCADGYQCLGGNKHWNPELCEQGYKCVQGVKSICPAGEFQPVAGQSYCIPCKKGFYCPGTGTTIHTPTLCEVGKYCPEGAQSATNCPQGTINPVTGRYALEHCVSCDPGYYCPAGTSSLTGLDCPTGKYCNYRAGSSYSGVCAAGQFCPVNSVLPSECTPGKYCATTDLAAVTGDCSAGFYCLLSATTATPSSTAQGGGSCPAGTYCEAGSIRPTLCQPGTFSNTLSATLSTDCQSCTGGRYCDRPQLTAPAGDCAERFYCPSGAASKYQTPCPAGSKCTAGVDTHSPCSAQSPPGYQPRSHSNFCIDCPAGYTCTDTAKTICDYSGSTAANKYCLANVPTDCPAGKIIDFPGAGALSDCINCPPGNFCDGGSTKIQVCTGGNLCEGGASANSGTGPCPAGSYCANGKRSLLCTAGRYCENTGNSSTQPCPAGFECPEGTAVGTTNACPAGAYCPQGTAFGLKCPPGTYLDLAGQDELTDCKQCTAGQHCKGRGLAAPNASCQAGYYCPAGSTTEFQNLCGEGYKCPVNSAAQTPCDVNTYQGAQGQDTCFNCPIGYQCTTTQSTNVALCQAGYQCATAGSARSECPVGTYGPTTGLAACLNCYPGSYCATTGITSPTNTCDAGYVCLNGADSATPTDGTKGKQCPEGYYCTGGTLKEIPCPPGTYGAAAGLTSEGQCTPCKVGKYCPQYGMKDADVDTFLCDAGYLCSGGSSVPTPTTVGGKKCSAGKKCAQGATAETDCELGTYNPAEGQSACRACPKGFVCSSTGLSAPIACPNGNFCPAGASAATPCAAGTYSDRTKLFAQSQCKQCEPGQYCAGGQAGTSGQCAAGYACPEGASTATPSGVYSKANNPRTNGQCPKGHKCAIGTAIPTPCERGTYQKLEGQSTCDNCPVGKYCEEVGLWDQTALPSCADGFHCISGSKVERPNGSQPTVGGPCTAGNYCSAGVQIQCAAGTYEPRTGSSACQTCPEGYFCALGSSAPTVCPKYFYCPAGSGAGTRCPDGTKNDNTGLAKAEECEPCPMGFYCQNGGEIEQRCTAGYFCKTGNSSPTPTDSTASVLFDYSNGPCPTGHYCPNTSDTDSYPQQCPTDKVRNTQGAAASSDCTDCPAGYFCPVGLNQAIICPRGYYCVAKTAEPATCPNHSFGPSEGFTASSECIDCNSQTAAAPYDNIFGTSFCDSSAVPPLGSLDGYRCPIGHFCTATAPGTTSIKTECVAGTFSATRGAKDVCGSCTPGSYCQTQQVVPLLCSAGKYCPGGSTAEQPCPAGYYCAEGSGAIGETTANIGKPEICPAAYYCPEGTIDPIKCIDGTYCPAQSQSQTSCPVGFYGSGNPNNVDAATGCITCDRGTYTSNAGVTECQTCTAGYVCSGGTNTATPTIPASHNGYICPVGHYCPAGSFEEIACPVGTYNPSKGQSALSQCLSCPAGSYNDKKGQDGCVKCAGSAHSVVGATACSCDGAHRVYQPEDGACVCATGFQSIQGNNVDSKEDCFPEATSNCATGQVRSELGVCVGATDCPMCDSSGGTRIEGLGFCNCQSVQYVQNVCDATCQSTKPAISITTSGTVQVNSGTAYNLLATNTQITGTFTSCADGQSCKIVSVVVNQSTGISASYSQHAGLFAGTLLLQEVNDPRHLTRDLRGSTVRELTATNTMQNPIVCIHVLDTFIFNVDLATPRSNSVYPIYVAESVLNTDANFDNSEFLKLADRVLHTADTFSYFAFQFDKEGLFVFATNANANSYMIVRVLPTSESCPSEQQFIQPLTEENLLSVGVQAETKRPADSDWLLYMGMLLFFIVVLMVLFLVIAQLHAAAIAREKEALLEEGELELSCWERCCPCIGKRRRKQVGVEGAEWEQKELTIDDLRDIKDLATHLKKQLVGLYGAEEDEFADIYKNARKLNKKLKRVAEENGLQVEEDLLGLERERQRKILEQGLGEEDEEGMKKAEESEREEESEQDKAFKEKLEEEVQRDMGTIEQDMKELQEEESQAQRKELGDRLAKMKQLSEEEKRQLLLEQETNIARAQNLLKAEAQKQEGELARKLNERKAKRALLEARIKDEEAKKREAENQFRDQLEFERGRADQDIKNLADLGGLRKSELERLKEDFEAEREQKKDELKQRLQQELAKAKVSARAGILARFDQEQVALLRKMEKERQEREDRIGDNIESIAQERREQRKKEYEDVRARLQAEKDAKMGAIDQEIANLRRQQDNARVEQELAEADILDEDQRRRAQLEMRRKHQMELRRLKRKEADEMDKIEKALDEGEAELETQAEKSKAVREEIQKNQLKRAALEARLGELASGEDDERKKIVGQLGAFDSQLMGLEKELKKQREGLEEKLAKRRKQVRKKMERRSQLEGQMLAKMDQQKQEELEGTLQLLNEDFQQTLLRISKQYSGEELSYAVERAIDKKQAEELKALLSSMLKEKFEKLKVLLEKLLMDKVDETRMVKEEWAPKFRELEEENLGAEEYRRRFRELQNEEAERKKDLDLKYFEKQNAVEESVMSAQLDEQHDGQLLRLKEKQLEEKNAIMKKYISREQKSARLMEQQRRAAMQKELADYKDALQLKMKKKMEEKELERAKLLQMQRESEQRMRQFEQDIQKANMAREQKERQRLDERRAELNQRREFVANELKGRADLSEAMKKELLAKHEAEMRAVESALEEERRRQHDILGSKLQERRLLKQRYREERDRKLAVYKLHKEKMIDQKMADLHQAPSSKTDFERVVSVYADNVKTLEKLAFPHRLEERQVRPMRHPGRSNASIDRVSQKDSFAFGFKKRGGRGTAAGGSKKTNLKAVLNKLNQIENMINSAGI